LLLQIVRWLSILVFVAGTILEVIFESERVGVETLQAALCVHLLLGLLWVFLYALIEAVAPGSSLNLGGGAAGRTLFVCSKLAECPELTDLLWLGRSDLKPFK
jgi:hypothetical protein